MTGRIRWNVSAGAVLFFALLYFFDDMGLVAALAPAVLVHELGHVAALRLGGARLRRVSAGVFGIEMDYVGDLSRTQMALAAAAGPAAGLAYAMAACSTESAFFRLSGAVSFCLSAFNLLPALPLDGGRIAAALSGSEAARTLSRFTAALLLLGGGLLLFRRFPAPLLAGIWLTVYNFKEGSRGTA